MSQVKVSYKRHLAKTISYRVVSTSIGFIGMWWATGSLKVGAAFGVVELIYKPLQYYIHERVWFKWVKYGLITEPEKKKKTSPEIKVKNETPQKTGKKVLNYSANR